MCLGSSEQQGIRLVRRNRWLPWPQHHHDLVLHQSLQHNEEVKSFQEQVSHFPGLRTRECSMYELVLLYI